MSDKIKNNKNTIIRNKLNTALTELERIFSAAAPGVEEALLLRSHKFCVIRDSVKINEFAKFVAEIYQQGQWLRRYYRYNYKFLNAEFYRAANIFCLITTDMTDAEKLTEYERLDKIKEVADKKRGINSAIKKLRKTEHLRNKYFDIWKKMKKDDSKASTPSINKEFYKWLDDNDIGRGLNNSQIDNTRSRLGDTLTRWRKAFLK